MPRSRGLSFPPRRSSTRRLTEWGEGPFNVLPQSITSAGVITIAGGQEATIKSTLVRIRGEISLWLEAVGTIGDGYAEVDVGIGIVSADAFTAGAASMPSPALDKDWPWWWHSSMGAIVGFSVTESENTGPISQVRAVIDSKAMRKIAPNETVFGVVATRNEIGVATLTFTMNTRMLTKLS